MENQIMVSIICNAYNHGPYIAKCLDGFVMQRTNFVFEILVHDDASTDNTADIIRTYEEKYPHLIKPIYQTENQYSKGGIGQFQYPRVRGKYIAMCEGDDYWTDPLKLQKQYDAMEAHPEIDICTHAAELIDNNSKKCQKIEPRKQNSVIPVEDVISGGGAYVATNSIFYRAEILENEPPFREIISFDYSLQIYGSLRGGMLYLSDCMSVYRYMTPGSWTDRHRKDLKASEAHSARVKKMMLQLDIDTEGKYHDTIMHDLLKTEFIHRKRYDDYKSMLAPKYRVCMKEVSRLERVKIYLKAYFPILITIKKRIDKARWG